MSPFKSILTIILIAFPMLAASQAHAQSPADEFARQRAGEEQAKRLDALKKMTPDNAALTPPISALPVAGGKCFPVRKIVVEGASQFPTGAITRITRPFAGKCVGLAEINTLLHDLTYLYLDKGFITSRVYIPEQDMAKTKLLRLMVVEGTLSDVYLNGKPAPKSGILGTAFPALRGTITNMRDIEQGLDQINRLGSNNAKSAILPGKSDDTSILNVENKPDNPLHFSLANSNLGQKSTGFSKSSASVTADDVLGINDMVSFTYEHSGPDYPWNNDGNPDGKSNSYSGNFSVPYGYWTASANGSWYEYKSTTQGQFSTLETNGDSGQAGFGLDRVILRDKDSITTVKTGLTYKQTNNFMLGNRIEVGSRQYTVGSISISHSRRMFNGLWVFDASYDRGLDMFGAVKEGAPGAGNANPKFSKLTATINASIPFKVAGQRFELSSTLNGQYSRDNLFGGEQISLGSASNVRGARESLLSGNNGFFLRNEVVWRMVPWKNNAGVTKSLGELRPYLGLDYGHVMTQRKFEVGGGNVVGWTGGLRIVGGVLTAEAGYSAILASNIDYDNGGLFFFNTSMRW